MNSFGKVPPGIYYDIPYDEYDAWPFIRKSNLWVLYKKTPAHYKYLVDHPEEFDKEHFAVGHATHTAILEPDKFDGLYVVHPKTYTNAKGEEKAWSANANYCKEWVGEQKAEGKIVLSPAMYEACMGMRDAAYNNSKVKELLELGRKEVSMVWADGKTGLILKGRMDLWIPEAGVVVDIKTCRTADPVLFGRDAYGHGYHFQMALYKDGAFVASKAEVAYPILIAFEETQPYLSVAFEVEYDDYFLGQQQYEFALKKLLECMNNDNWPGYSDGLLPLTLPGYAGQELSGV